MKMRIPSGVVDQYIYFVAVDATDLITRETGLSSFTVYRSRNGGAATAYTTPTINETSSANMPGVYELLLDEDMTIDSGDAEQEVCLHITHAGMAPVTRVFTIFRPPVTASETLTVSSGVGSVNVTQVSGSAVNTASAQLGVNVVSAAGTAWNSGAITDNTLASGAITAAKFAANALDAVWSTTTRLLTAGTNIVLAKGTGVTGFNDLDAAGVRSAVGLASANLDTQLSTIDTVVDSIQVDTDSIETKIDTIDSVVDSIQVDTNSIETKIDTVDSVLDALVADVGANGSGLTAIPWNSSWDAEVQSEVDDALVAYDVAKETEVPTASAIADAVWDEALSGHSTPGTAGDTLADIGTGGTAPTVEEIADELETRVLDVNIVQVNSIAVDGTGTENDPWGPS
jgi:hypothetical protein